jgi:hydroxyacylglutathione hydrolase
MRVVPVACLSDNYAYLVVDPAGVAAIVDASEAAPVRAAIAREKVVVEKILSTHHHWDHVGGNEELAAELGVPVVGHASDRGRLPGLSVGVEDGDTVNVGGLTARCLHVPGHTLGAVTYYFDTPSARGAFTGDTMFCAGCGRMFEGTPAQMHASLQKIAALPDDTRVYCGHEYTANNLRFAASIEDSDAVAQASARAAGLRSEGKPTVGTTLVEERATNPFLRGHSAAIRRSLAIDVAADDATAFAAIRKAKDGFR